jgi:hypothetical protein
LGNEVGEVCGLGKENEIRAREWICQYKPQHISRIASVWFTEKSQYAS